LQPTASREGIHQEENFVLVQRALEQQLRAGLRKIADTEPGTWQQILSGHHMVILSWAVRDDDFFDEVANLVPISTSRGPMVLPDYLNLTDSTLYYVQQRLGTPQEQLLGEGRGVPVIEAEYYMVRPFLEKYAHRNPGVSLTQMDGDSKHLLRAAASEPFSALISYYREQDIRVRVVQFRPEEVPALMIYPKDAEFIVDTRQALDRGTLPSGLAGLVSDYMNRIDVPEEDLRGTLHLNASCSLIQILAEKPIDSAARNAVLMIIYQVARLFAGRMLTPADAAAAFGGANKALEALVQR
jgi:molecular chaperone HtpG